ncbi:hypothetical protein [Haloarcula sp. Atlit-7R]|uniref:hypothetical protein n=1 Tax=Haloarcula sp. Atlit-7R TaxID=2282125 RepID=UPI000EF16954|nr:hypothetical protein [Haloarcula sp. Atlit-7R]RLM94404.1 hypothetical protein D3D01_16200 [Haloarcula sp. Atlit-7R]
MDQELREDIETRIGSAWSLSDSEGSEDDRLWMSATHEGGAEFEIEECGDDITIIFEHNSGRAEYITVTENNVAETVLKITEEYEIAYEIDAESDAEDTGNRFFGVINPSGLQAITFCREGSDDMVFHRATYAAVAAIRVRRRYQNENLQVVELSQEWGGDFSDGFHSEAVAEAH